MKLYPSYLLTTLSLIPAVLAADSRGNLRHLQGNSGNAPGNGGGGNGNGDGQKTYIVTFKSKAESPSQRCDAISQAQGGSTKKVYKKVLNGCAMSLPPGAVEAMKTNPNVALIEEDQEVFASQTDFTSESWGLDRINQCTLPLDNTGTRMDATGVKVYILDTGIQKDNVDFTTPLNLIDDTSNCHADTSGEGSPLNDGNGHGTHVASTTCGNKYGVASNCNLCAVKVLTSRGSGTWSGVIAGIDHVAANCNGARCVANMSLGGGKSDSVDTAVANAVAAGVTMVVAAGNDDLDACNFSPAGEPSAITVGSTTSTDARSSFSNKGAQCLDVFAPGSGITAAWIGSNTATRTISGTSMASPHVAGIAAGILGSSASNMSPAEVLNTILLQSKSDIVSDHQSPGIPLATTTYCNVPTVSPAPTPTPPNLEVEILTDNYPEETTWTLTSDCGGESISGGTYSGQGVTYKSGIFNASGQYTFTINDSYGDGICCGYGSGSYKVMMDGVMMAEGGAFGASATHTFGTCPTGPTNPPTMKPTSPPTTSPTPSPTKQPVVGPDCGSATDRRSCNRIDGCDWNGRFKTCILA